MTKTLRHTLLLFSVLWSLILLPEHALAQTASLSCSSGSASGELFDQSEACKFSLSEKHIFSAVICQFVTLLNDVLGSVYCGLQQFLQTMVGAVLTIYIALFGLQMLLGLADANAREFLTRMVKIGIVWIFVSDSTWAIQTAFNFFVSLAGDGVEWVMSSIPDPFGASAGSCYDAAASGATEFMAAFVRMDVIICKAVTGPLGSLDSKVVGFFAVMCILAPQVGILSVSWLWLNFKILLQGVVTFLLGIAAIAFLIAMSPIFLSMMLFKSTAGFFENWLRYMTSFSLQIIIVFACIALWLTVTVYFLAFFNDVSATIFPDQKDNAESQMHNLDNSWGVCPFIYSPNGGGSIPGPSVKCKSTTPAKEDIIPISGLLWKDKDGSLGCEPDKDCTKYIFYVIYHLITLIIVAYAFEALLREAPRIAVYLAGPDYTPPLAGGFGISRAGQIRSLFSSADAPAGTGDTPGASAEGGGFSVKNFAKDLFGSNSKSPKSGAPVTPEGQTYTQELRERLSSMPTGGSGNPPKN